MRERYEVDSFWEGLVAGVWCGAKSPRVWALGAALAVLAFSVIHHG